MKREALQKAKPFFREFVTNRGKGEQKTDSYNDSGQNAVWGALHEDGTLVVPNYHVCFGAMRSYKSKYNHEMAKTRPQFPLIEVNPVISLFAQLQDTAPFMKDEAAYHYFEWLMNYSPWRHAFVTKSPRVANGLKAVIIDPSTPANLLAGALIAFKQPWENYTPQYALPRRISLWWELAQHVNPAIAFAAAQGLHADKNIRSDTKMDDVKITTDAVVAGHGPLSHLSDRHNLNFLKDKPHQTGPAWNKDYMYGAVWEVWNGPIKLTNATSLSSFVKKNLQDIGKGAKNVNPFVSNIAVEYRLTDVIECLKTSLPEFEKELEKVA